MTPRYLAPIVCSLGNDLGVVHTRCSTLGGVTPVLHAAYTAWAAHHTNCKTCGEHHWFNPGVLVTRVDPLVADGAVTLTRNGTSEKVTYRRGPDTSLLCPTGRELFNCWCYGGTA